MELRIIKGLYNHNSGYEISNNIYPRHNEKPINIGHCHACNGPHLIKGCNKSTCGRCKPNLDNHTPSTCPRKCPFNKQQSCNPFHNNDNSNRNKLLTTPNQTYNFLSLEATRKMTKYFKGSYKHSKSHPSDSSNCHSSTNHFSNFHPNTNANHAITMMKTKLLIRHTYLITHHQNPKIVKNTMTQRVLIAYLIPPETLNDSHRKIKLSKLNNTKYAANFPVTINNNQTISCNKVILKNRINYFLVETSFHHFSNMASSGLKKMFIL